MVAQVSTTQTSVAGDTLDSLETYFERELTSEQRHEYRDGVILPMTGGTPNHNRIIRNLCSCLTWNLKSQDYEVFVSDQRLWIPAKNLNTYPDLMVVGGDLIFQAGRKDTIMNPIVIVEVLSQSTQAYDRGDKFAAYRTIPGLQEYILINQYQHQVEQFIKHSDKQWLFQECLGHDSSVSIATINSEILIADIYDKVIFEGAEA